MARSRVEKNSRDRPGRDKLRDYREKVEEAELYATDNAGEDQPVHDTNIQTTLQLIRDEIQVIADAASAGLDFSYVETLAVNADAYGDVDSGDLPIVVVFDLLLFGLSVIGDARTNITYDFDGVTASETAPGEVTITAINTQIAYITYTVEFAGIPQGTWVTAITLDRAAGGGDPNQVPVGAVQTAAMEVALSPVTQKQSAELLASRQVTGGYTYRVVLAAQLISLNHRGGNADVEILVGYKPSIGNAWTMVDPSAATNPADVTDETARRLKTFRRKRSKRGSVQFSQDVVVPSGTYDIGIFGRLTHNSEISFDSPARIEPA